MLIALAITGYIAAALLTAYIFGRLGGPEYAGLAVAWPMFLLAAILFGPLVYAAHLGSGRD